jgi:hypothetical protein
LVSELGRTYGPNRYNPKCTILQPNTLSGTTTIRCTIQKTMPEGICSLLESQEWQSGKLEAGVNSSATTAGTMLKRQHPDDMGPIPWEAEAEERPK